MKCTDMDRSIFAPIKFTCVTAAIVGLIPATQAQERLQNIERAPENQLAKEKDESLAKYLGLGPLSIRPHFYGDTYYDSNITLGQKDHPNFNATEREDWVWRFMPGVLFGMGEFRGDKGSFLSLDYTMDGNVYSKYSTYNSLDHYVIMSGGWKLAKLTLGLSQSYQIDHGKLTEVGGFVSQESYVTLLTSKYEITEKTSAELNGRQSLISGDTQQPGPDQKLNSINEWTVEGWGDYKVTEKLSAGAGLTLGWRDIRAFGNGNPPAPPSPNQRFEQGLVRAAYQVTEKVQLYGSAGVQFSQFENGDDKGATFVFDLIGSWRPLENTLLALEAYRRDVPSLVFNGLNYTLTGLRFSVKQDFLEKYSATFAAGFENSDYTDVSAQTARPDRRDNYFFVRPGLEYTINERSNVGVFYQFRTKDSNQPDFDYSCHQIGLFTNYRF